MLVLNVLAMASAALAIRNLTSFSAQVNPQEGLYFADCQSFQSDRTWKEIDFYNNARGASQNQQLPDDFTIFDTTISNSTNSCKTDDNNWLGAPHIPCIGGFESGSDATLCWSLADDALIAPVGEQVGSASNSFGTNYNCFADNYRLLYVSNEDTLCFSRFFCFAQV